MKNLRVITYSTNTKDRKDKTIGTFEMNNKIISKLERSQIYYS